MQLIYQLSVLTTILMPNLKIKAYILYIQITAINKKLVTIQLRSKKYRAISIFSTDFFLQNLF